MAERELVDDKDMYDEKDPQIQVIKNIVNYYNKFTTQQVTINNQLQYEQVEKQFQSISTEN